MGTVLILANNDIGLYNFRKELIERLLLKQNRIFIALPFGDRVKDLVEMGCEYIPVPIDRRGTNPFRDAGLIMTYVRCINKVKPDVVLTYTIKPNIYGGFVCRLKKIPYFSNITGLGSALERQGFMQRLLYFLYRVALRNAECIFFQNKKNCAVFQEQKIIKGRYRLIPGSGVNITEHVFEPYPNGERIVFLFVGRIMKEKGIEELLETASEVKRRKVQAEFHIIGGCEEMYEEQLKKLTAEHIIQYYGHQSDVHKYMKEASAIILPSYHEGMANVLLEGASTGRPILASRIPGCQEAFEEAVTGLGFEQKSVESLLKTVLQFCELTFQERKQMGEKGRRKIEKEFDRELVVNAYMEELNPFIGGKGEKE